MNGGIHLGRGIYFKRFFFFCIQNLMIIIKNNIQIFKTLQKTLPYVRPALRKKLLIL